MRFKSRSVFWDSNFTKYFQLILLNIFNYSSTICWKTAFFYLISFECIYMDQFKYFFFNLLHLIYLLCIFVCMCPGTCILLHMSEEVEEFDCLLPRNWTHVNRCGNRHLYLMSCITGPEFSFFSYVYISTLMQWNLALYSYAIYLEEWKANSPNLFF